MPGRIPPIKEFPDDGRIWRIEWLGAVEQTQPEAKIDVHLCEGIRVKPQSRRATQSKPSDIARLCKKVGVGQLPYLTLGSVWRNRRRLDDGVGTRQSLTNLQVDDARIRLVSLDHPVGETHEGKRKWLIPPFSYSLPPNVYRSFCIAIERDGDPYAILLPVAEAIRFYYALSSDLAHVMFSGLLQLSPESVYDIQVSGKLENTERMIVSRVQWLADNDCWIIGRILGHEYARDGANRIYNSLAKATANRVATFPECKLPFCGAADWTVRAVDIATGRENPRWLVLEIEKCSAPFPFEELEVIADNDARGADEKTDIPDDEKLEAWRVRKKQAISNPDDQLQSGEAPAADVKPIVLSNPGACFEALQGKRVIKTPKSECRYKAAQLHSTTALGNDIGTGDGTHGNTSVKPGKVVWDKHDEEQRKRNRRKALGVSFDALYDVVDAINAIDRAEARVRESKALTHIPLIEQPSRRQWSWLDSGKRIRRETLLIDILIDGRHACLVEFQQRDSERCVMGLLVCHARPQLDDDELGKLLRLLAKKKGVWNNVRCPYDGVKIISIRHTKPTTAELTDTIAGMTAR